MLMELLRVLPGWESLLLLVVVLLVVWTFANSAIVFLQRPTNVTIVSGSLIFGKWLSTINFLFRGSDMILKKHTMVGGSAFALPALQEYQVLISQPHEVQQLTRCPKDTLSFHEAMKDRLSHKQIMLGFEHNDIDANDSIPIHVLKVLLRNHLHHLAPIIQLRVTEGIQNRLQAAQREGGRLNHPMRGHGATELTATEPHTVSVFSLAKSIMTRVNNQILFGDDLATNDDFENASIRYGWDGAITMEVCRLLPKFLAPIVGQLCMAWSGAMDLVGGHVRQLVQERLRMSKVDSSRFVDCTQFVINVSRTERQRAPERITQQMVALLFASAHQLPMALSWAIIMLCEHPEYVHLLRRELADSEMNSYPAPIKKLKLLDCFLRESSRLNPLDAVSIQRKAMKSFSFSDGPHIPAGNLVAVPQQAVMRDSRNYTNAEKFDPFRFLTPSGSDAACPRYTDVNLKYPFWGSPSQACPGRWYASDVLKHAIIDLIRNFDVELDGRTDITLDESKVQGT
ncbi:cytochrome P450 [Xylariomycetidae sp. FL0641]|nr:cytochrome P450 [Xylariomycetidae sp. FL0641]